ncbi:SAVED domain-containing protein [Allorhizobium undicola]|uniref:SAVED domain-containing protein n=1 Tax=Allorhizobium undicola TaxID=78527 RepID=UPI003D334B3D
MFELVRHAIITLIDWIFRRRSPALQVMRIGLSCLAIALGVTWALDISIPLGGGEITFNVNAGEGTPGLVVSGVALLGGLLILVGLIWEIVRYNAEQQQLSRKKVIVIEARGLRDGVGLALADAVPTNVEGRRDAVIVDLRQGVVDGHIVSPQAAVDKLVSLPVDLERRELGTDRSDLLRVYGGLAPVPFTFLTGVLIDDETSTIVFDWDRHLQRWRLLDAPDDQKRFVVDGMDKIVAGADEVALLVSVSYQVDAIGVGKKLDGIAQISLSLDGALPDSHWSEDKQRALGQQFLETTIQISNMGIRRIHLFLAAQNSVVFRFGCLYDKRNLPELIVYQYQREENPPYPWGVLMPVGGRPRPEVV